MYKIRLLFGKQEDSTPQSMRTVIFYNDELTMQEAEALCMAWVQDKFNEVREYEDATEE